MWSRPLHRLVVAASLTWAIDPCDATYLDYDQETVGGLPRMLVNLPQMPDPRPQWSLAEVHNHPHNAAMEGWSPIRRVSSDPKVVVTVSTTPRGYESLKVALDSLLNQTYKPDEIHANIPHKSARGLGPYPDIAPLEPYSNKGVQIFRTLDWGSLTNIVPTRQRLEANKSNTLIIVVDDDKVSPPSMVEDHVRAHRKKPNAAHTCRGYHVTRSMAAGHVEQTQNEIAISVYGHKLAEEKLVGVVTGSDTWSVQADGFDESLWSRLQDKAPLPWDRYDIGLFAKLMNDIWVSGCLGMAGRPKYAMPCREEVWNTPAWTQNGQESVGNTDAMRQKQDMPSVLEQRDKINAVVMKYFESVWKPDELRAL